MNPLVSILIPTWNRAPRVGEAIQCGLKQTYPNVEVLVYDDGSADETEHAVRRFKSPRFRYVRGKVNHGPAAARNALIRHMKGEYGCWQDSDDHSCVHRVALLMDAMRKWNPPFVRSGVSMFYLKNAGWWKKPPEVFFSKRQVVATALFRRDCSVPFDEKLEAGGEDVIAEMDMVMAHGLGMVIPFNLYQIDRRKSYKWATRVSKWHRKTDPKMIARVKRSKAYYHATYDRKMAEMKDMGLDSGVRAEYVPACHINVPTGLRGPQAWCHGMRQVDWRHRRALPRTRLDLSQDTCAVCAKQRKA